MRLQWTEETVQFMRWASEHGDYHRRLAAWMRPHLPPEGRLCDAGCGLGYLAVALAPYAAHVTAIDRSETALAVLREVCARRDIRNIAPLAGDVAAHPPAVPYDAMVFCFFGGMETIAALARRQCRGEVFVFTRDYTHHRFSVAPGPVRENAFLAGTQWLRERGIPFSSDALALEMGQPFPTLADARRFFLRYGQVDDEVLIDDGFLRRKLVDTGRRDFPLYLPQVRQVGCLRFCARDL